MAGSAKTALAETFMELLNERPFEKITVTDITNRCGVNRNTFYYHYQDIYDLLDQILRAEVERIGKEAAGDFSTWRAALAEGIGFAVENKDAIYNLYNSLNRNMLETYLYETIFNSIERFVDYETEGLGIDIKTVENVKMFMSCAIEGVIINWLNNGMKEDPLVFIDGMGDLFDGAVDYLLAKKAAARP